MNVFVCGCLQDFQDIDITKIVDKVFNPFFDRNFLKYNKGNNIYVFCRDIVHFCRDSNWWYFSTRTCATEELFSCFVSMNYGVTSLCPICFCTLAKKLFPFLIKIK